MSTSVYTAPHQIHATGPSKASYNPVESALKLGVTVTGGRWSSMGHEGQNAVKRLLGNSAEKSAPPPWVQNNQARRSSTTVSRGFESGMAQNRSMGSVAGFLVPLSECTFWYMHFGQFGPKCTVHLRQFEPPLRCRPLLQLVFEIARGSYCHPDMSRPGLPRHISWSCSVTPSQKAPSSSSSNATGSLFSSVDAWPIKWKKYLVCIA